MEIQPVQVKIDYKPKRLNLKALQQGSAMEVINLFHFESAMMTLRHVTMNGVSLEKYPKYLGGSFEELPLNRLRVGATYILSCCLSGHQMSKRTRCPTCLPE